MIPQIGTSGLIPGLMEVMEAGGIMPCWSPCWGWLLFVSHRFPNSCIFWAVGVEPRKLGLWDLTDASEHPSFIPNGVSWANYLTLWICFPIHGGGKLELPWCVVRLKQDKILRSILCVVSFNTCQSFSIQGCPTQEFPHSVAMKDWGGITGLRRNQPREAAWCVGKGLWETVCETCSVGPEILSCLHWLQGNDPSLVICNVPALQLDPTLSGRFSDVWELVLCFVISHSSGLALKSMNGGKENTALLLQWYFLWSGFFCAWVPQVNRFS